MLKQVVGNVVRRHDCDACARREYPREKQIIHRICWHIGAARYHLDDIRPRAIAVFARAIVEHWAFRSTTELPVRLEERCGVGGYCRSGQRLARRRAVVTGPAVASDAAALFESDGICGGTNAQC